MTSRSRETSSSRFCATPEVRYVSVERDTGWFDTNDEPAVIVPIGIARLDRDDRRVIVGSLASTDFRTIPGYRRDAGITREYETTLRSRYTRPGTGAAATGAAATVDTDPYAGDHYDDNRFYGRESNRDEERITLSAEEMAVGKRTVVKEELVIKKHQVQDQTVIEADLRKERAEVHSEGDVHRADATTDRDSPLRGGRNLDGDDVR